MGKLLEKFESDSFGDALWSKVVLFMARRRWNHKFERSLWSSMGSLGVLLKAQCPPNLRTDDHWKSYFVPFVEDSQIVDHMMSALETVPFAEHCRHSFLYFVAIVGISHRIWEGKCRSDLLRNVLTRCTRSVAVDVINCNFQCIESARLDAGVQEENEVEMMTLTLLAQTLNIGKASVVCAEFNQDR